MKFAVALAFAFSLAAADPRYQLVPNWPQLPPDLTLGPVTGVSVDAKNRVWVFHRHKEKPILCFDGKSGKLLKALGGGLIENAHGLTVGPDANLWLTDLNFHQVLVMSPDGKLLQRWGEQGKPAWDSTHFNRPTMVAFGPDKVVYVGDGYGNSRVAKFTLDGKYLGEWGKPGSGPGEFKIPHSLTLDKSGLVYVADRGNSRVQIFNSTGTYLREWKSPELGRPWAIAAAPDGSFFVVDGGDEADAKGEARSRVLRVDSNGKVLSAWGSHGKQPGNFIWAHDIALGPDGAVYVGDVKDGCRIQKFVRKK
jgi:peptidylamidoglycolate lyase